MNQITLVYFWSHIVFPQDMSQCWLWHGIIEFGYGRFWDVDAQRMVRAHRFSYEFLREPIPSGLHLDHLCRIKNCVNPYHLETVTNWGNVSRGNGPTALNARKTHCSLGHSFTRTVTRKDGRTYRKCGTCEHNYNVQRYAVKKAVKEAGR